MSEVKQNESYLAKSNNINDKNLDFIKDRYQEKIEENNHLIIIKEKSYSDYAYYGSAGLSIFAVIIYLFFMISVTISIAAFSRSEPLPILGVIAALLAVLIILPIVLSEVKASKSKQEFNRLEPIIKENIEFIEKSIKKDTIEEFAKILKKQHNATFVDENFPYIDSESTKIRLSDGTVTRAIIEYNCETKKIEVSILDDINKVLKIKKDSDTKRTSKAKNKFSLKNRYKKIKKLKQAKQD